MTVALLLAAVLAVACVVLVALPFLREPEPETDVLDEPDAARRGSSCSRSGTALAALKELEFDHRTGKISDEDYRRSSGRSAARPRWRSGRSSRARRLASPPATAGRRLRPSEHR